jgi:hypothetical protein
VAGQLFAGEVDDEAVDELGYGPAQLVTDERLERLGGRGHLGSFPPRRRECLGRPSSGVLGTQEPVLPVALLPAGEDRVQLEVAGKFQTQSAVDGMPN